MNYRHWFGENREKAIQRDNEQCVLCGMTREQHRAKYGRDITVDHIDGNGRNATKKNNSLHNLRTLCLPCHGRYDVARRNPDKLNGELHPLHKLTADKVLLIRELVAEGMEQKSVASRFGVSPTLVCRIVKRNMWKHI